jgi:hypothetical protein
VPDILEKNGVAVKGIEIDEQFTAYEVACSARDLYQD